MPADLFIETVFSQDTGCAVIAEIGQAHDGSLGTAHAYIDAVAKAGAFAVKFQTHIADAESSPLEPWRVKFSHQDKTRQDYWRRMEFSPEAWAGLFTHAREKGMVCLSSPFSFAAVDLLESLDMPAWKIPSGEITNIPLLERVAKTGKPVLLSSGMSSWDDLGRAAAIVRSAGAPLAIFQCATRYPCPPESWGLNLLAEMRRRCNCPVGLSDHSGAIYAGIAAAALGARMVEVHVVFSKECFGPDTPASVTTAELALLVEGTRAVSKALANPVDKDAEALGLSEMRRVFGKSVVLVRDCPAGHSLVREDVDFRKPGTGIPSARLAGVLGKTLKAPQKAGHFLSMEDLA
jgi:N-acetylneuraminate synthase